MDGVKYLVVRGVNEKGQRYLDQYDLETKTHEKRPLQGGADALVVMSDTGLMAMTSGGKMQVFNMAARQLVSSASLPAHASTGEANSVVYWKFVTANSLVIVSSDKQVFTWSLAVQNQAPSALFKVQEALQSGVVLDVQMSEDAQWFAVVVHTTVGNEIKPQVQMTAVARGISNVQEASAAAVYTYAARGCSVMALTSKGPAGYRLMVAELATAPGAPKFERLVLELPGDSAALPVCLLRQGLDQHILTVVTKNGDVHVASTETRAWIAHSKLGAGNETFFAGAFSVGFNHLVAVSQQGSVYAITTRALGGAAAAPAAASATSSVAPSSSAVPAPTSTPPPATPSSPAPSSGAPTTSTPPRDPLQDLSLQSMVEPRKPMTPLDEFFSVYPPEALTLYKNDRSKFLPYIVEQRISLNWQGLLAADKDMSVASKLAFGQAVAHLNLSSRGAVVSHFDTMGYLSDTHAKLNYMLQLIGTSNSPADADVQTNTIVLGLKVDPTTVVNNVVRKQWTHFDGPTVAAAALESEQWDLVWLLATSFEQRMQLLSNHSLSISANQILQWFNSLPADGGLQILETLVAANATGALSWERIAAPPNDRLAPHIDLTTSAPFQTLRVKIASANDSALWKRYISVALKFGEAKEISRILLHYNNDAVVNPIVEEAVQEAASAGSCVASLPLLVLAERSGKLEGLVSYHVSRSSSSSASHSANFLSSYITSIQPQNSARVVALTAQQTGASSPLLKKLLLAAAKAETLSSGNLWLSANQNGTQTIISEAIQEIIASEEGANVPLIQSYANKFAAASAQ